MRSSASHRNPSSVDRFADVGGTFVGVCALLFLVLWYLAHVLP